MCLTPTATIVESAASPTISLSLVRDLEFVFIYSFDYRETNRNPFLRADEYQIRYFPNFQQRFQAYGARENFTVAGLTYYLQPEVFPAPGVASSNFTLFNGTAGLLGTNNGTFQFQPCYFVGFITGANGAVTMYEFGEYNTRNYTAVRTCPSPGEFNTKALRCDANTFTYYCEVVLHVPSPDDDSANGVFVSIATVLAFVLAALLF